MFSSQGVKYTTYDLHYNVRVPQGVGKGNENTLVKLKGACTFYGYKSHVVTHTSPKRLNSGFSFGLCDEHLVVVTIRCEIPQRPGGVCFLRVGPIANQRHERRDATGLCDGNFVVVIICEPVQRGGGKMFLRVVPIANERHERRHNNRHSANHQDPARGSSSSLGLTVLLRTHTRAYWPSLGLSVSPPTRI